MTIFYESLTKINGHPDCRTTFMFPRFFFNDSINTRLEEKVKITDSDVNLIVFIFPGKSAIMYFLYFNLESGVISS